MVGLLVLPPLFAVVTVSAGMGFAPAHRPEIVFNTLLLGVPPPLPP